MTDRLPVKVLSETAHRVKVLNETARAVLDAVDSREKAVRVVVLKVAVRRAVPVVKVAVRRAVLVVKVVADLADPVVKVVADSGLRPTRS